MNQPGLEIIDCDDVTISSNTIIGYDTSIHFSGCSNINASKNTFKYGRTGIELIDCKDIDINTNTLTSFEKFIHFTKCSNINASKNTFKYGRTGIELIDCMGRANLKRNFGHQIDEMISVEQTENITRIVPSQKISDRDKIIEKNKAIVDKYFLELEHSKVKLKEVIEYERKFNNEIRELLNLEAQEKFLKNYAEVKRIQYKKANWRAPILALK